jgi:hypothetical protein
MFRADLPQTRFKPIHARRRRTSQRLLCAEILEERALLTLQGNQLFPADNPWNEKITNAPVAANSATLVASIGAASPLHPDFGTVYNGALIGIPYNIVPRTQAKINVVIDAYASESDLVPVPIPPGAVIEGDPLAPAQNTGDRHLIVYDKDNHIAYELFNVHRPAEEPADNQWHADSEAVWDMSKDSFRTPGFTSADAAGLPILPGLVRPDEVLDQGVINHALRFTVPRSDSAYVFPASHAAGVNNSALPRMGERFRLKQSFDISGFSATNRVILQALKDYGMIVADNGSSWFLSGEPSTRWSDDDLHALTTVVGSAFEAVNLSPLVSGLDQTSGSSGGGTAVTIHGQDFSGAAGQLQVFFGATAASNVSIISDTVLIATSPAHSPGTIDVAVQTPYGTAATSTSDQFTFTTAVSRPVISLSVGVGSPNYTTSWYNSGPVAIENMAQANVTDASSTTLSSMTITLATFHTGDVLQVPILASNSAISASYSAGTLTLTGTATLARYSQELRLLNYNNTAGGPGTSPIKATVMANDGTNSSTAVTATINVAVASGQVLGNRLFYNNSEYDGNNGAINASDDPAVASDKVGFNGVGTATFANLSSATRGITGVMVDLASGLGTHTNINLTSGDITFKVAPTAFIAGSYNQLSTWTAAPTPTAISVRMGAGTNSSDRLEITWATNAIKNTWLEVDLLADANTGLSSPDIFYFGSAAGDSGLGDTSSLAKVDINDANPPNANILGLTTQVFQILDYTKDGKVDGNDANAAALGIFTLHTIANPAVTLPLAPDGGRGAATPTAVATASAAAVPAASTASASSAVSSGLSLLNSLPTTPPTRLAGRLQNILDSQPIAKILTNLTNPNSPQIHQTIDQIAANYNLTEDALDGLLADLGLPG